MQSDYQAQLMRAHVKNRLSWVQDNYTVRLSMQTIESKADKMKYHIWSICHAACRILSICSHKCNSGNEASAKEAQNVKHISF